MTRPRPIAFTFAAAALLGVATLALRAAEDNKKPAADADASSAASVPPSGDNRYFEMRTYYTHPGRLDALNARFRHHTTKLFEKHGMTNIGYWTPAQGQKGAGNTLVYILAYPSKEARDASWRAFSSDPEWKTVREASEADGKIVEKIESLFLNPVDYSKIK